MNFPQRLQEKFFHLVSAALDLGSIYDNYIHLQNPHYYNGICYNGRITDST